MTDERIEAALILLRDAPEASSTYVARGVTVQMVIDCLRAPLRLRPVEEAPDGKHVLWYFRSDSRPITGDLAPWGEVFTPYSGPRMSGYGYPVADFRGWLPLQEVTDER